MVTSSPAVSSPSPSSTARPGWKFVMFVGVLTALGAITTDIYLPSLPEVAADLHTTEALAGSTISVVLMGAAVGTLLVGALSDRLGRRRAALLGISLHVLASIWAGFANSIEMLLAPRFLQGFGNATANVSAMAIVRDRFTGAAAAAVLSRLMLVIGVVPLLAPSLGAIIAAAGGWRLVFFFIAAYGALLLVAVGFVLPETLAPEHRSRNVKETWDGYLTLLRDSQFRLLALLPGLAFGAMLAYVVASTFVIQVELGLDKAQFSIFFAAMGTGMIVFAQFNAYLVRRVDSLNLLRAGTAFAFASSLLLLTVVLSGNRNLWVLGACIWLVLAGFAFIGPNATTLALANHGERAGRGAALIHSLQALVAAPISASVGFLGGDSRAMAIVMAGAFGLALAVVLLGVRRCPPRAVLP